MSAHPFASPACLLLSLILAPLLFGVINRVKAMVGGRQGRPLLQLYFDIVKLLRKNSVYPQSTTWFFRAAPAVSIVCAWLALLLLPFGGIPALFPFTGDFLVLCGFLALSRFSLILAALDTGSAFEGMGAAREGLFSAMAEPILLFCLMVLGYASREHSLSLMLCGQSAVLSFSPWPMFFLLAIALFLLLLTENCRIPVDDPCTHLELTMIHEVMILDHSGPDLALLEYAAALKLWLFSLLIADVTLSRTRELFIGNAAAQSASSAHLFLDAGLTLALVFAVAVLVGYVESVMARLRLERVPQILTLAGAFACFAALSLWR